MNELNIKCKIPLMFPQNCMTAHTFQSTDTNLGQPSMMWFQTIVADLRFQARLHPAGRQLRPPPGGLLPLLVLPLQPVGVQLPLSAHGPLPEMGVGSPPLPAPLKRRPSPASRRDRRSIGRDNHCITTDLLFSPPSLVSLSVAQRDSNRKQGPRFQFGNIFGPLYKIQERCSFVNQAFGFQFRSLVRFV